MESTATHELSEHELNAQCTQKINEFEDYLKKYAKEDDDLIQEGNIGIYDAIKEKNGVSNIKDAYYRTKLKFVITNYLKKGKSIDNGFWKRDTINIIPCDSVNSDVSANILKDTYSTPVDQQVIDKITLENLLNSLSGIEKRFVHLRIIGLTYMKIMKRLRLTQKMLAEVQNSVRCKIDIAYA